MTRGYPEHTRIMMAGPARRTPVRSASGSLKVRVFVRFQRLKPLRLQPPFRFCAQARVRADPRRSSQAGGIPKPWHGSAQVAWRARSSARPAVEARVRSDTRRGHDE